MSIPTKHRDKLLEISDGKLIITIDVQRCLLIYPLPTWEKTEAEIVKLSSVNKNARGLQRLLVGNAEECAMDAQGRVLLPGQLREFASLDKKVILVGQVNKFELWNEQSWYQHREQWLQHSFEHPDDLAADVDISF